MNSRHPQTLGTPRDARQWAPDRCVRSAAREPGEFQRSTLPWPSRDMAPAEEPSTASKQPSPRARSLATGARLRSNAHSRTTAASFN